MSSVVKNAEDGNGWQLEKLANLFFKFSSCVRTKIIKNMYNMVLFSLLNFIGYIGVVILQEHFVHE